MIGEGLDWGFVGEAFEAGSIVVVDELGDEGVAIGVVDEGTPGAAPLFLAADGLSNAAIEAFDHAVGLRVIRPGEAVIDAAQLAELIKGVVAGRFPGWLVLLITAKRSVNSEPLSVRMV